MLKRCLVAGLATAMLTGLSCEIVPTPAPTKIPLNEAHGVVRVSQMVGGDTAVATARVTESDSASSAVVVLEGDQAVYVNDLLLIGPDADGNYARTIPSAANLKITVAEPTRGTAHTTMVMPGAFSVTSPSDTASLGGFTVIWTNADPSLKVLIELSQAMGGSDPITKSFGPVADSGSYVLSRTNLADFRWGTGVTLTVKVTRIREMIGIEGFKTGKATAELWQAVVVTPTPVN